MICKNCKSRMKKDNLMKAYLNLKMHKKFCVAEVYTCKYCNWRLISFNSNVWVDENNKEVKL